MSATSDDDNVLLTNATIYGAVSLWFTDRPQALVVYGNIGDWDVRRVTTMSRLFEDLSNFNDDISRWNTSNVTDLSYMFYGAASFN